MQSPRGFAMRMESPLSGSSGILPLLNKEYVVYGITDCKHI